MLWKSYDLFSVLPSEFEKSHKKGLWAWPAFQLLNATYNIIATAVYFILTFSSHHDCNIFNEVNMLPFLTFK
jgi:MFS-type transporter involved in bile tolerance (Atg22 family)